jgi:hypothetical protein
MCKIIRSRVAPQPSLALERDKSPLRGAGGLLNLSHSASEAANLPPKRWNLGLGFRAYARVAALLSFFDGFPVLETHALETHLRKCILLIVLNFAKGPSRPVFVGHCFQRHSGSREQILFLIFLSFAFPCFGNPSPKMHSVNSVGFCKRAQSANFRRPLFSKTFWVQRTDREWWQVTSQGKPLSRALLPTLIRPGRGGQIKSFGSELKLKISESATKLIHADSDGQNVCFFAFLK